MRSPCTRPLGLSVCRLLVIIALLASAGAARAQPVLPGEPPTRGPEIPAGVIAGDADATATVLNAANMAFLPAWNLVALYTHVDGAGARGPGGGGLYFASPLPLLDMFSVGAAVELVRPPDAFPYGDIARLALSLSIRPLRGLGLGLTWGHVFTGSTPGADDGIDTLDLSIATRFGRHVAFGLVVRDVPAPQFQGLGIQRVYEAQLAVRPLGNDRLELAPAAWVGERRGDFGAALRLQSMLYPGVLLRGQVAYLRDETPGGEHLDDVRATVGLELNLARVGLAGYALLGNRPLGNSVAQGFSVVARVSGDRYPTLYSPARLERLDLSAGTDQKRAGVLAHLQHLERDPRTFGVLAVIGDLDGSWGTMEELREALHRLRRAGKHVFVYGTELTTKSYYVAAAAERIYLDPAGGVRFIGMSSTSTFFRDSLALVSVHADFVKIAEYKSAPEQFTREGPSPEALQMRRAILDDVSRRLVASIARDRGLAADRVIALRDMGPFTAKAALEMRLVDELVGGEEVEDAIGKRLGRRVDAVPRPTTPERLRTWQRPAVAAIFVDGDIVEGRSRTVPFLNMRFAGHETIIRAIEAARGNPRVAAIVLRVNSPGGSALASDLIAREIARTKKVKPVVCSLGDTAASGGYFIAAPCDRIFAAPSTITGSIGIFTGKFDFSGLAARLGVGLSTLKRGDHADIESPFRPYTAEERAIILDGLRYYYGRFVDTVAAGRKLTSAQVDAVGRGRVWTGAQAKERGLVDELGGFEDAVREAKRRSGLSEADDVETVALPEEPSTLLGQIGQLLGARTAGEGGPERLLSAVAPLLRGLPGSLLVAPSTPQARLPLDLQ